MKAQPVPYALTPLGWRTVAVARGKRLRPETAARAERVRAERGKGRAK